MTKDIKRLAMTVKLFIDFQKLATSYNCDESSARITANNAIKEISGIDLIDYLNLGAEI